MALFSRKRTYLDFAAAAPATSAAVRAFARASREFGNPSSPHEEGRAARATLEEARTAIARELSMKADDIIFTSGATEANTIAIEGHVRALMASGRKGTDIHLLYLPSAHASVVETMQALSKEGVRTEALPIRDGEVDIEALARLIRPETALVSVDFVCGETGTIWNVREVRSTLDAAREPGTPRILLHVDATQAPLEESLERTRLGADLITLDAQKIGGVRGIGILAASRTIPIAPLMHGGSQERSIRPGTESPALAAAFAAALNESATIRKGFPARAHTVRASLSEELKRAIPDILINEGKRTIGHILNLSLPGRDTDYLVALMDECGFAISTKSACETDAKGSRAVLALTGDAGRAESTLRISWGPSISESELRRCGSALIESIRFIDSAAP